MKKTLCVFLGLIIILSSLSVALAREMDIQSENVEFVLNSETGDRELLQGITAKIEMSHLENLIWNIDFSPFSESKAELTFKKRGGQADAPTFSGLWGSYLDIRDFARDNRKLGEYVFGVEKSLKKTGDSAEISIRLKDYYDYYPVKINLDLPGLSIHYYSPISHDEKGGYSFYGISEARGKEFLRKLSDFIRIPVREDDVRKETVEKMESGYSHATEYINTFDYCFLNAQFSDRLFFTVGNLTGPNENCPSVLVDTSETGGGDGYGIYSVPFTENDIRSEEMKTVFKIDESSTVIYLDGSEEKNELYVCLLENGNFILKVIDASSFSEISSVTLFSYSYEKDHIGFVKNEDFLLFYKNDLELKTVTKNSDGTYSEAFHFVIPQENSYGWDYYDYESDAVFCGDRLIFFICDREKFSDQLKRSAKFRITAFGADGRVYSGEWENSLGENTVNTYTAFVRIDKAELIFDESV